MACNIDAFKLVKSNNFSFSVSEFENLLREANCSFKINNYIDGSIGYKISDSIVYGFIKKDNFFIYELYCAGESSSDIMYEFIKPMLSKSSGELNAIFALNDTHEIVLLSVKEGKIEYVYLNY